MVRRALRLGLGLALAAQPLSAGAAEPAALSPTAAIPIIPSAGATPTAQALALSPTPKGLPVLPERPPTIPLVANQPLEDFFAVTIISVPFTALWGLVGALVVGSIAQSHFPPNFSTPLLASAAIAAAGSSVVIGLVSVQWGAKPGPKAVPPAPAAPIPTPSPRTPPQP